MTTYSKAVTLALIFWAVLAIATIARAGLASSQYAKQYAEALCLGLEHSYGAKKQGIQVKFDACKPARFDRVTHQWDYWVFFRLAGKHSLVKAVVEVDPTGNWLITPIQLSSYEYTHRIIPSAGLAA